MGGYRLTFRWWYLLLLLPPLLYGGAYWYVGHRIDRAIASANSGDNSLSIDRYDYGLIPLQLTVTGVTFDQQRAAFEASGSLQRGSIEGVNLLSLVGSGPIKVGEIALRGLNGSYTRTAPSPTSDSSNFALRVASVRLDSFFATFRDQPSGREARVANLNLALQPLQLPFSPTEIDHLLVSADTAHYLRRSRDTLRLVAQSLRYDTENRAITLDLLHFTKGGTTDLRAHGLGVTNLQPADLSDDTFTVDSVRIDSVGGGARVQSDQGNSGGSGTGAGAFPVTAEHLAIAHIDASVTGGFGTVAYRGGLTGSELDYREALSFGHLRLDGQTATFEDTSGLAVVLTEATLQQEALQVPLNGNLGTTRLAVANLHLSRGDELSVTADTVGYVSDKEEIRLGNLDFTADRVSGRVSDIGVAGFDREALLDGGGLRASSATLTGLGMRVRNRDGGQYTVRVPEATLTKIDDDGGLGVQRLQLSRAVVRRRGQEGKEDLVAREIYLDQYGIRAPFELSTLGETNLRVAEITLRSDQQPIDYRFSRARYESRAGVLTLDSLNRYNELSPAETFRQELSRSWLSFSFDALRATGIDHDALLSGETVAVDSLLVGDFRLTVIEAISLEPPSDEKRRPMPLEALRQLGPRIVLGGVRLSSTDISYGAVDSVLQPKTIHFNNGVVLLHDLDTQLSETDSVRATIDATFERTTPMHAEFILARDSSGRNYAVRGELGTYDLSGINPLMEVAADAIIETGIIKRMQYEGALKDEVMTGRMRLLYRDLDVKIVGGGAWIKNLLSGVVVKKDNLPGEDFRPGNIYHEHGPDRSFFNAYWKGLVSGMRSSALSDIALKEELD